MTIGVEAKNYSDLMFGHFNTPAALDELMGLIDWGEMYSAVELPAAAILVPQGSPDNTLGMFRYPLYAIFGAKRNANGWTIRGLFYCVSADGFEGELSQNCTTLKVNGTSASVQVRFFSEY
jgi:hypothetical protein